MVFPNFNKHELTRDTRKETILPHYGSLARVSMELSHGYHTFIKTDVQTQVNLPLSEYLSVQASTHAGYIQSLGSKSPHLMDKFFLGGPLILRGFHPFHAGPNIQSNRAYPIGGNVYWVLAAHLYSKIPFISQQTSLAQAIRLHAFANVGNLGNVGKRQGDFANFLFNDPLRASVGLGICLAFAGQARLELNYVLPVRSGIGDRVDERKAQFAFGVQYS